LLLLLLLLFLSFHHHHHLHHLIWVNPLRLVCNISLEEEEEEQRLEQFLFVREIFSNLRDAKFVNDEVNRQFSCPSAAPSKRARERQQETKRQRLAG